MQKNMALATIENINFGEVVWGFRGMFKPVLS